MRGSTGLRLSDEIVCINIIDQFVEVNEENYITKVMMKIEDTSGIV